MAKGYSDIAWQANAEADKKFEEDVAARNTADGMVHAARKTREEGGEHPDGPGGQGGERRHPPFQGG